MARGYYYNEKFGKDLHGIYVFGSDSKSARDSSFASGSAQLREVVHASPTRTSTSPSFAPQSAYTPVVQEMKTAGSNYGQATQGSQAHGAHCARRPRCRA